MLPALSAALLLLVLLSVWCCGVVLPINLQVGAMPLVVLVYILLYVIWMVADAIGPYGHVFLQELLQQLIGC